VNQFLSMLIGAAIFGAAFLFCKVVKKLYKAMSEGWRS